MAQSDSIQTDTSTYISPPPTSIFNGSVSAKDPDIDDNESSAASSSPSRSSLDLQEPTPAPDSDLPSDSESQDAQRQPEYPEPYVSPSPSRTTTPGADGDIDSVYSWGHPFDDFDIRSIPSDAMLPTRENTPLRSSSPGARASPDEEELELEREWESERWARRDEDPEYVVLGERMTTLQEANDYTELFTDICNREEDDAAVWIHLANRMKQAFKDGKNLGELEDEWEEGEEVKPTSFEEAMQRITKAIRMGKVKHELWMTGWSFGCATNWPQAAARVPRNEELHPPVRLFDYDGGVVPSARLTLTRKSRRKDGKVSAEPWDLDTLGDHALFKDTKSKSPRGRFCAEELRGHVSDDDDFDILGQSRKRRKLDDVSFSESRLEDDEEEEEEEEEDVDMDVDMEEDKDGDDNTMSPSERRLAAEVEKINERIVQPDTHTAEPDRIPRPEEEDFEDPPLHALRPFVDALIVKYERMLKQKTKKLPEDDEVFESKIRAIAVRECEAFEKVLEGLWAIRKRYMHAKFGERFIVPIYPDLPGPIPDKRKPHIRKESPETDERPAEDDQDDQDDAPLSESEDEDERDPTKPPKSLPETLAFRQERVRPFDWHAVLYSATVSGAFSPAVLERAEKRCKSLLGKCASETDRDERLQKLREAMQQPIQKHETRPYKPSLLGKRYKNPHANDIEWAKEDKWWGEMEEDIAMVNLRTTPGILEEAVRMKKKHDVQNEVLFKVLAKHRKEEDEDEDYEDVDEVNDVSGSDDSEDDWSVTKEKEKKEEEPWKREWEEMVKEMMDDDEDSSDEEVEVVKHNDTHKAMLPAVARRVEAAWQEAQHYDPIGRPYFDFAAESKKWKKTEEMMRKISDEYTEEREE